MVVSCNSVFQSATRRCRQNASSVDCLVYVTYLDGNPHFADCVDRDVKAAFAAAAHTTPNKKKLLPPALKTADAAVTTATQTHSSLPGYYGIVVVGVLAAVAVAVAVLLRRRTRRNKRQGAARGGAFQSTLSIDSTGPTWSRSSSSSSSSSSTTASAPHLLAFLTKDDEIKQFRLDSSDLVMLEALSCGGFGEVWLGTFGGRQVAVKTLRVHMRMQAAQMEAFAAEIKHMVRLAHPRIVQCIGVCWSSVIPLSAVMEFMDRGDLRSALEHHPRDSACFHWTNRKIGIAAEAAEALAFLHSRAPPVIHRDVKSRNVMLHSTQGAKLGDFGCSRFARADETMSANVGTLYWTAPEVLRGDRYAESADVYSFGIVLWELQTHAVPFVGRRNSSGDALPQVAIGHRIACGRMRLVVPDACPVEVASIVTACLQLDPRQRPPMRDVFGQLERLRGEWTSTDECVQEQEEEEEARASGERQAHVDAQ